MKLFNADCLTVLKTMESDSIDCIVTSPPYDDLRTYNDSSTWDFSVFKTIAKELTRVIKNNKCIVWVVNDATVDGSETGTSFKQVLHFKELGLNIHDTMIWNKTFSHNFNNTRYTNSFEYMFILSKGTPNVHNLIRDKKNKWHGHKFLGTRRLPNGELVKRKNKSVVPEFGVRINVWDIPSCQSQTERQNHPAQFPIAIAKDHILTWTNEKDIILDPFMGSGTTGIACLKTDRNFVGIEIDKDYFNVAENRLKKFYNRINQMKKLF